MSNLKGYQVMTTWASKLGGPIQLAACVATGGYVIGKIAEKTIKKGIEKIKQCNKKERLAPKVYMGGKFGVADEGSNFSLEDQVEVTDLWEEIKNSIKRDMDLPELTYSTWIQPLEITRVENDIVFLKTEIEGLETYIDKRFFDCFSKVALDVCKKTYQFKFDIR